MSDIQTIKTYGAVSEEVALEMVIGVATKSHSDVAVSITGVAGPTGGTPKNLWVRYVLVFLVLAKRAQVHNYFLAIEQALFLRAFRIL